MTSLQLYNIYIIWWLLIPSKEMEDILLQRRVNSSNLYVCLETFKCHIVMIERTKDSTIW